MARVFDITAASDTVRLDGKGQGEIAFTASNVSGRALRGRAILVPQDPASKAWLSLSGDAERDFPPGGTQQFAVKVAAPAGSKTGKYNFRVDVVNVQNPDEDYTQGPTVVIPVTLAPPPPPPFKWWILVVAAVVLAVIAGVVYWLLSPKAMVPSLAGKTIVDANTLLTQAGLKLGDATSVLVTNATQVDQVLNQDPPAGQKARPNSAVNVEVGVAIVVVPSIVGRSYKDAVEALHAQHLDIGQVTNTNRPGTTASLVLSSTPPPGNSVKSHQTVDLVVQQDQVPVPNVVGQVFASATAILINANLKVGTVTGNVFQVSGFVPLPAQVVDQSPKTGTLPVGSQVNLAFPGGTVAINPVLKYRLTEMATPHHW